MLLHIYCDESRQTKERYMVLGGIIVPAHAISEVTSITSAYRQKHRMNSELKWTRIHKSKYTEYQAFVDLFFDLMGKQKLHFHSLIIDTSQVDHGTHNEGDRDIGFYKFFYQLLIHSFGKKYCREGEDDRFIVKFDHRDSQYSLTDLKTILNNGMEKRFSITARPFHAVESIDSKTSDIIQFADILMGAVGYQKNGCHLQQGTRQAKIDLALHIAKKAGIPDLEKNTPWGRNSFTIWNFKLRPTSKAKK